jgi:hypothetical protein
MNDIDKPLTLEGELRLLAKMAKDAGFFLAENFIKCCLSQEWIKGDYTVPQQNIEKHK